jgi:hypothetical protein
MMTGSSTVVPRGENVFVAWPLLKYSKKQLKERTNAEKISNLRFMGIHLNGGYASSSVDIPGKKP